MEKLQNDFKKLLFRKFKNFLKRNLEKILKKYLRFLQI